MPKKLIDKQTIRNLMKAGQLTDVKDIQTLLKEQFKDIMQEMLEAELDYELGYSKYDYKNKETDNSRNGARSKTVRSDYGDITLDVPRDRKSEFEPIIVKKNERDVSSIDDQVMSMYAKGMTTRDITKHLQQLYGIDVSPTMISQIIDKILPIIKAWQQRPLSPVYAHLVLDTFKNFKTALIKDVIVKTYAYDALNQLTIDKERQDCYEGYGTQNNYYYDSMGN